MTEEFIHTPISWGEEIIDNFIPKEYEKNVKFLHPPEFSREKQYQGSVEDGLLYALEHPIGIDKPFTDFISEMYEPGKPLVILVDDNTRPNIHTKIILPTLLAYILSLGVPRQDIRILVAAGTHRPPREDEFKKILGKEIYEEYKDIVVVHDCNNDVVMIGTSKAGTPIGFNALALEASVIIPVTDSELHYFAGVAGTIKQLCPGIAARKTVSINHPKMFDRELGFVPECRLGNTEGNPVITDIKDIAMKLRELKPIFAIDTIVTEGEIVYINAGDIIALHEEAAKKIVKMRTVEIEKPGDLVIIGLQSWGINLYQTGKGIHAAWNAVRKDGKGEILIVSPCPDGVGNANFEKAMRECKDLPLQEALEYILDNYCSEETFKIGNQKPVDLLRIIKTVGEGNLKMITYMDHTELKEVYRIVPLPMIDNSPEKTIAKEVRDFMNKNPDAQIYVMDDPGLLIVIKEN